MDKAFSMDLGSLAAWVRVFPDPKYFLASVLLNFVVGRVLVSCQLLPFLSGCSCIHRFFLYPNTPTWAYIAFVLKKPITNDLIIINNVQF